MSHPNVSPSEAKLPPSRPPSPELEDMSSESSPDHFDQPTRTAEEVFQYTLKEEKLQCIKVLESPLPAAAFVTSTEGRDNPYWWPYSQQIRFSKRKNDAFPFSSYGLKVQHTFLYLATLSLPKGCLLNGNYIAALKDDIFQEKHLLPHHGVITIRKAVHPEHLEKYAVSLPPYEANDGLPLLYALADLMDAKLIESIDLMLFKTTQLAIGKDEPTNGSSHFGSITIQAKFESVRVPRLPSIDPIYAGKLERWIKENPSVPIGTYGRIIALDDGTGVYQVQQGLPIVQALGKVKSVLNGDQTIVPVTLVQLVAKENI